MQGAAFMAANPPAAGQHRGRGKIPRRHGVMPPYAVTVPLDVGRPAHRPPGNAVVTATPRRGVGDAAPYAWRKMGIKKPTAGWAVGK